MSRPTTPTDEQLRKLPRWAQFYVRDLAHYADTVAGRLATHPDSNVVASPYHNPYGLTPGETVQFTLPGGAQLRVKIDGDWLSVMARGGGDTLAVQPQSSSVVLLRVTDYRGRMVPR